MTVYIIQLINKTILLKGFRTIEEMIEWVDEEWSGRDPYISMGTNRVPGMIKGRFLNTENNEREDRVMAHIYAINIEEDPKPKNKED